MQNHFAEKLKELRERHFPQESLRRLGQRFEDAGLGKFFYTQISKMENGTLLPSEDFIRKIERAYGLTSEETLELMTTLMFQRLQRRDFVPTRQDAPEKAVEAVGKLFRKAKKKKDL